MTEEKLRLVGLKLGVSDGYSDDSEENYTNYDIGLIAYKALDALKIAVLAVEQVCTGERLVQSLDIGDFYAHLEAILEQDNGQGILSESGAMASLQDEIQGIIDIVEKARRYARQQQRAAEG